MHIPVPPGSRAFRKSKEDILECPKSLATDVDNENLDEFLGKKLVHRKRSFNTLQKISS